MPRAARTASESCAGSSSVASLGSSPRVIPSRPAASSPPSAIYGLHELSAAFSSRLVEPSTSLQNGEATRSAASRLSCPHAVYALLHDCGWSRLYELKLGQVSATNAGR